jgi:hypothetical protein
MARIFLGASALLWLPYGVFCFFDPAVLAGAAGVSALSTTGTIEMRAMYGGLQIAIGALAAAALVRADLVRPALVTIGFLGAGLFTARLAGATLGGEFSSYTVMALGLEIVCAAVPVWLLGSARARPAGLTPNA